MRFFGESPLWNTDSRAFGAVLKKKIGVNAKYRELFSLLFNAPKAPKNEEAEDYYCTGDVLKLLCGGTVSAKDLFGKEEYAEIPSFSLDKDDDALGQIMVELGDDGELIRLLKAVFDWAILADILEGTTYISQKKVLSYEEHKADLALLKQLVRKYAPAQYKDVFRNEEKPGYASYVKSGKAEDFCKFINGIFKNVEPKKADTKAFEKLKAKIENRTLCPKQVVSDNRVIPYQGY